jgi:hypothetical protein
MQTICPVEIRPQTSLNKPATTPPFSLRNGLPRESRTVPIFSLPFLFAFLLMAALSAPTDAASLWTGSGPGTATVVSDGSIFNPQFQYFLSGDAAHSDQTWDFHTTADADGSVTLPYCWRGFHAFFQVTTHLQAYVTHLGVTTFTPLVSDGPVDCCTPPSAGFHYIGTISLNVQTGDTYGFQFGGQNFDSDSRLLGTFSLFSTNPPSCNAGGPYSVAEGATSVQLNGTGSSDPDNDLLTYLWTTDCPDATFDDPTSPTPVLTFGPGSLCSQQCMVTLTVDDGCTSSSCSNTVTFDVSNKCPLSQGYWKTHAALWPVTSITLGTVTYSQAELLAILMMNTGTGKGADASLILADQLIAAKLSIANGSNPCPIASTVAAADALIGGRHIPIVPKITPNSTEGQQMVSLAAQLQQYNNAQLTPGCTP